MREKDLIYLREQLTTYFNKSELYSLCFDLGINHELLSGETLPDKTRELVSFCIRHDQLSVLSQRCKELRPQVSWPDFITSSKAKEYSDELVIDTRPLLGSRKGKIWEVDYNEFPNFLQLINHVYSKISHEVPTFSYGIKWVIRDSSDGQIFFQDIFEKLPKDDVGHSALIDLASHTDLHNISIYPGMKLEVISLDLKNT